MLHRMRGKSSGSCCRGPGAGGTTYVTVVNRATSPVTVNVSLAGTTGVTGGTATVLTGDPTAMNSIARPLAVAPATRPVGHLGPSFRYKIGRAHV